MPDAHMKDFGKRLDRINRQHAKLARGYVTSVNHDGLIIARPRPRSSMIPWRGLMFLLVIVMAIKVLMHWQMGQASYEALVTSLQSGGTFDQILAYGLVPDRITVALAELLGSLEAR